MFTEKHIRNSLNDYDLTNRWLQARLYQLGVKVDKSTLSNILTGARQGKKADEVLCASELILKDYAKAISHSALYKSRNKQTRNI